MEQERILVKSLNRNSNSTSSSDFTIDLPRAIQGNYLVRYVHMPNALYNVVANSNDTVYTSLGNATLTAGYYSSSTFATMLQTRLQVANVNFTAAIHPDTKKVTITNTGAFTLNFATTIASAAGLLGFLNANTASATSQTGTNTVNLIWSQSVSIHINKASSQIETSSNSYGSAGHILVPFTVAYGSYEIVEHSRIEQWVTMDRTSNLSIKLYDTQGNAASLNGAEWEMLLQKI